MWNLHRSFDLGSLLLVWIWLEWCMYSMSGGNSTIINWDNSNFRLGGRVNEWPGILISCFNCKILYGTPGHYPSSFEDAACAKQWDHCNNSTACCDGLSCSEGNCRENHACNSDEDCERHGVKGYKCNNDRRCVKLGRCKKEGSGNDCHDDCCPGLFCQRGKVDSCIVDLRCNSTSECVVKGYKGYSCRGNWCTEFRPCNPHTCGRGDSRNVQCCQRPGDETSYGVCLTGSCKPRGSCVRNGGHCFHARDCCWKTSSCKAGKCVGCLQIAEVYNGDSTLGCMKNADCCGSAVCRSNSTGYGRAVCRSPPRL